MQDINVKKMIDPQFHRNLKGLIQKNSQLNENQGYFALERIDLMNPPAELLKEFIKLDRRHENDPTFQGYYALHGTDRRKTNKSNLKTKWVKISVKSYFSDGYGN